MSTLIFVALIIIDQIYICCVNAMIFAKPQLSAQTSILALQLRYKHQYDSFTDTENLLLLRYYNINLLECH